MKTTTTGPGRYIDPRDTKTVEHAMMLAMSLLSPAQHKRFCRLMDEPIPKGFPFDFSDYADRIEAEAKSRAEKASRRRAA